MTSEELDLMARCKSIVADGTLTNATAIDLREWLKPRYASMETLPASQFYSMLCILLRNGKLNAKNRQAIVNFAGVIAKIKSR